ncbi:MAG: hypothetical protein ACE5JO_01520 [Candidatus Binatia bacterium]
MNRIIRFLLLSLAFLFWWSGPLSAEYTLVLKNGRRITVQSYREEGGMIKFYGLGGEIGIARDQIQSILKAGGKGRGMVFPGVKETPARPSGASQEKKKVASPGPGGKAKVKGKKERPAEAKEKVLIPEEKLAEERSKEEEEYQKRVREITEQIKAVRDRYALATRGSSGPEPSLLNSQEAIRARTDDLISRLRDAQHNPAGPSDAGGIKLSTPSSFAGAPPTTIELRPGEVIPRVDAPLPRYTGKQKELSELRNQIIQLQKKRERLIQEMRQKNFDTGSLFLE